MIHNYYIYRFLIWRQGSRIYQHCLHL